MSKYITLDSERINVFFKAFKAIFIDIERGNESKLLNVLGKRKETLTREDDEYCEYLLVSISNALFPFLKYVYDKRETLVFDLPKETEWALASIILLALACIINRQYSAAKFYMKSIDNVVNDYPDINHLMAVNNNSSWFKRLTTHKTKVSMSKSLITIIKSGLVLKSYIEGESRDEPIQRKSPLTTSDQLLTFAQIYKKYGLTLNKDGDFYGECFDGFSQCDIWRLTVDGRQQFRGTYAWLDWEANAAQAIHHLWDYIKASSQLSPKGFTEETLKTIHEHATLGVDIAVHQTTPGIYRDDTAHFTTKIGRDISVRGLIELHARVRNSNYYSLSLTHRGTLECGGARFLWDSHIIEDIPMEVKKTLSQYEAEVAAFYRQPEERRNCRQLLRIIINCAKNIVLMHPFHDGNGRTAHALLNLLLLRNKLPPTILYSPGVIAAYTEDELVEEILQGMDNFFYVKKYKSFPQANYKTAEIIKEAYNNNEMRSVLINDFFRAISVNDSELVMQYVTLGFDMKTTDSLGNNALMVAASNGHIKLLEFFIGPDENVIHGNNVLKHTALYHAVFCGQKEVVLFLLKKTMKKSLRRNCVTLLRLAVLNGDESIFDIFLQEADREPYEKLYEKDENDNSLLMLAATSGNVKIFRKLLDGWNKEKLYEINRHGDNVLMLAAKYGHNDIFNILIVDFRKRLTSLECSNKDGLNVLMLAIQGAAPRKESIWGMSDIPAWQIKPRKMASESIFEKESDRTNIIIEFLKMLPDNYLKKTDRRNNTALMLAIESDDETVFYALLHCSDKSIINHEDNYGNTALTLALIQKNKNYVEALLPFCSSTTLCNDVVLRLAVRNRHYEVLKYIVEHHKMDFLKKENIYAPQQYTSSILSDSIHVGDRQSFDLLLSIGQEKSVFKENPLGETLLMLAARNADRYFLEKLLDISDKEVFNRRRSNGQTALFDAAINDRKKNVELMLEKYPGLIKVNDADGNNALMCAARWGCNEMVAYLINKYAISFLRKKNLRQQTALMITALENCEESFGLLLKKCDFAIVRDKDDDGCNVLMLAAYKGYLGILNILLRDYSSHEFINDSCRKKQTAVMLAASQGHTAIVERLIATGCDLFSTDENGNNALMLAIKGHHLTTVRRLLQHYTEKKLLKKNNMGNNALMLAASFYEWQQQEQFFKLLLTMSPPAALNAQNDSGETVLMLAARHRNLVAVKLLLAANPKPIINATNNKGQTAFLLAAEINNTETGKLLCKPSLLSAIHSKDKNMIKSIFSERCCPPEMLDFAILLNPVLMQEVFDDLQNLKVKKEYQLAYDGLCEYITNRKNQIGLYSLQRTETLPLKKIGLIYILCLRLSRASYDSESVKDEIKGYIDVLQKQSSILKPRVFGDKNYSLVKYISEFIDQLGSGCESSSYGY